MNNWNLPDDVTPSDISGRRRRKPIDEDEEYDRFRNEDDLRAAQEREETASHD